MSFSSGSSSSGSQSAEGGFLTLTHVSLGFAFHFSHSATSLLSLWGWWHVWSDCRLLRQSKEGHVWLFPSPLSSWRLRPHRLHCLHGWWLHFAWQWSPTWLAFGDWAISVHTLWDPAVCCFLEGEVWSSTLFCLPSGHSRQCLPKCFGRSVSQRCRNRFGCLSHSLVCLISVSWHTAALSHFLDLSKTCPVPVCCLCVFHGFMEWIIPAGFSTALKYTLTCFSFCLLWFGGRSSTNRMVSVGVSYVVPCLTLIASFIALSSFCRFVCCIVLRPRPVGDTENHTLIQSELVALLNTFWSHSFKDWQAFLSHVWEWRETIHSYLWYDGVCFALIIMTFAADREASITVREVTVTHWPCR